MTATATPTRPPAEQAPRVPCPTKEASGCTYATDEASMPAHVAMAHPDVPIDTVAPKRSARNGTNRAAAAHTDGGPGAIPPATGPTAPVAAPSGTGATTSAAAPEQASAG